MVLGQHGGRLEEADAVGDPVAHEEVGHGRDREVTEDLAQGIDLILVPHRADLEKSEARMHGQHQNGAHEEEQCVGALRKRIGGRV